MVVVNLFFSPFLSEETNKNKKHTHPTSMILYLDVGVDIMVSTSCRDNCRHLRDGNFPM